MIKEIEPQGSSAIPIYKITVPITGTELVLSTGGEFHYGVKGIDLETIKFILKQENTKYKGNIFRLWVGDLIENALKKSIGHNYDIEVPDPEIQKTNMTAALIEISKHMYGSNFNKIKTTDSLDGVLQVGCIGNHEYRTRKESGQWLDKEMYNPAKILSIGLNGILELTIINKKLKLSRVYKIYLSHRPSSTSATSEDSIIRAIKKKRADVPGCDLYVFGHYHQRIIRPDGYIDSKTGLYKKALLVVAPSPMYGIEYADVAGYGTHLTGYNVHTYLPLDPIMNPYGIV